MTINPPAPRQADTTTSQPSAYVQTRLQGITDLTVLAPIKTGFVEGAIETCTYVERLRRLLKALDGVRHATRESALQPSPFSDLVGRLNIVHFFRFAIVPPDANDKSGRYRMLLNVTFDGGWEAYMRVIWRDLGSLLDAICCNCDGYQIARMCPFDEYIKWVRKHEVPGAFFYADSGDSLGDQHYREYLETLALTTRDPQLADYFAAVFRLDTARQAVIKSTARSRKAPRAVIAAGLKVLAAFHAQLRAYVLKPPGDAQVLQRFTQDLLQEFLTLVREKVMERPEFEVLAALYADQLQWFSAEVPGWKEPSERLPVSRNHVLSQVQGGILDPYADVTHGCLALLRVQQGKASEVIDYLAGWAVTGGDNKAVDGLYRNIAFTYRGLQALGIGPEHLDKLPFEFKEGMEARAGILGDLRSNHPDHWRGPKRNWPPGAGDGEALQIDLATIHVVVQLRTKHTPPKDALGDALADDLGHDLGHGLIKAFKSEIAALEQHGLTALSVQPMRRYLTGTQAVGHMGFVDGISQPDIENHDVSLPSSRRHWSDTVKPGEVLLGYGNGRGDGPCPANPDSLLDFGSFLVVRKLRQRLDVLNQVIADQALKLTGNAGAARAFAIELQEKMMGRRKNGDPLAVSAQPGNDFNFKDDPTGAQCPFHSHVRRLNPRLPDAESPPLPRIVRRGMSYGPQLDASNEGVDRGVVFMAYGANIAEQFEVLQRWIAGSGVNGFTAAESDPFLGVPNAGTARTFRFLHNGKPLRVELGEQPFVQLEWGLYLFTPSLYALTNLKTLATTRHETTYMPQGIGSISSAESFAHWQQRLEDPQRRDAAWQQVRTAPAGVLDTAYGVLVGSAEWVTKVLVDRGENHSVSGYGERLSKAIGNGYLGQDPHAGQDAHTGEVNRAIADVTSAAAYATTCAVTSQILNKLLDRQQQMTGQRAVELPLPKLIDEVLAALCKHWFGLPDGTFIENGSANVNDEPPRCPGHSFSVAQYVFWPSPSPETTRLGQDQGAALARAALKFIRSKPELKELANSIDTAVRKAGGNDQAVARTLIGVMQGLPPTVSLTLLTALRNWVSSKSLWDLQLALPRRPLAQISYDDAAAALQEPLFESMRTGPVPPMLWRTTAKSCEVGAMKLEAGRRIIVGLESAIADCDVKSDSDARKRDSFIFGGNYGETAHGCPGREMALGIMIGLTCTLLNAGTLRPTANPLAILLRA
jgi:Dyp-type peroxidase family